MTSTFSTEEQTRYNLIVYLMTAKGERVFNPEYGTTVRDYLFEQNVDDIDIKDKLQEDLNNRFSKLADINVLMERFEHDLTIKIQYKYKTNGRNDEVILNF